MFTVSGVSSDLSSLCFNFFLNEHEACSRSHSPENKASGALAQGLLSLPRSSHLQMTAGSWPMARPCSLLSAIDSGWHPSPGSQVPRLLTLGRDNDRETVVLEIRVARLGRHRLQPPHTAWSGVSCIFLALQRRQRGHCFWKIRTLRGGR